MNYQKIYDAIIVHRKINFAPGYTESHHILPKCMGGSDDSDNIVRLTAREHYVCHWLLWKIHRSPQLAHAFWSMARVGSGQHRNVTSAMYARAKDAHVEAMCVGMVGSGNHFYGKKHSEETKQLLSAKAKARGSRVWDVRSEESKARYIDAVSRPKTIEHRKKIGRVGLKMVQNVETLEIRRVPKDFDCGDLWVNPRKLKPEEKFKCMYCDMVTTPSMLKRWHNENCKRKS